MKFATKDLLRSFIPLLAAVLAFGTLAPSSAHASSVLAEWNFEGLPGSLSTIYPSVNADVVGMGVNATTLSKGTGLFGFQVRPDTGNPKRLRFYNNVGVTTENAAVSNNVYGEFSLNAQTGYTLNLTTFEIDVQSAGSDQRSYFVRYSLDNFATFTQLINPTSVDNSLPNPNSAVLNLTGLSSITFRIYGFAQSSNNANRSLDYDFFRVNGTAVVPEPGTFAVLGLGIASLFGVARRRSRSAVR